MATTLPPLSPPHEAREKTVTGYPAHPSHVAAGYPPPTAFHVTTVHPYAVHPASAFTYHHRHASPPRHLSTCPTTLCRLTTAFLGVLFTLTLVFFITWQILKPKLPEFQVDSAKLTPVTVNKTEVSATWHFNFLVTNPNKKFTVYYDRVEAWVLYGDGYLLSGAQLPGFYQEKMNATLISTQLAVVSENVDGQVLGAITGDRARGSLTFDVRVLGLVRFRSGKWGTKWHPMRVSCESMQFGFLPWKNGTGTFIYGPRECKVDL